MDGLGRADVLPMRSALNRLLLACGLLAVTAVCTPSVAGAAAPQGSLTAAEYGLLLAAFQRSEALEDDKKPTLDDVSAMCEELAPRPTALVAASYAQCRGSLRVTQVSTDPEASKGCTGAETRCAARELRRIETATRSLARLTRAQRRVVAARGLTGQCARAINGPAATLTFLESFANALRDLRRAVLAEDARGLERATERIERATLLAPDAGDDTVALLATCPRV
jgi:hypothetical protein